MVREELHHPSKHYSTVDVWVKGGKESVLFWYERIYQRRLRKVCRESWSIIAIAIRLRRANRASFCVWRPRYK